MNEVKALGHGTQRITILKRTQFELILTGNSMDWLQHTERLNGPDRREKCEDGADSAILSGSQCRRTYHLHSAFEPEQQEE